MHAKLGMCRESVEMLTLMAQQGKYTRV